MPEGVGRTRFSVVTPCYNAAQYIREAITSVLHNTAIERGTADLQYIVCDGGSTDGTLAIVEEMFSSVREDHVELHVLSEPDRGMYDALATGLRMCTGDICCYINGDDFYSPAAFEIVLELFDEKRVRWLTGMQVRYSEGSHVVSVATPFQYRRRLIRCGLYGPVLPFIPQAATFWHRSLNALLDYDRLRRLRYAGDYYMWKQFCRQEELHIVSAWLGGFRVRPNQLSAQLDRYYGEMNALRDRPTVLDYAVAYVDKLIWLLPARWKKRLNARSLYCYEHRSHQYV